LFVPKDMSETTVLKPIKPISSAHKALDEKMEAPEPLDEELVPSFDVVPPIEPVRKNYRFVRWLVGILLLVLLVLGSYYVYAQTTRFVTIPDVYNKTQEEAIKLL